MLKIKPIIRHATKQDIPFLARMIILAETSGHELISYRDMFSLSDEELTKGFEIALDNEQEGHGLTYRSFMIAELDGVPAATAGAYTEGEHGSSNHLMTGALINGFGAELVMKAFKKNALYRDIHIDKSIGTMQLDSVATLEAYRGKGLLKTIFEAHVHTAKKKGILRLEVQVWAGNTSAIAAYQKLGCEIVTEKLRPNQNQGGRILMFKNLAHDTN